MQDWTAIRMLSERWPGILSLHTLFLVMTVNIPEMLASSRVKRGSFRR